jgi:hypothetical protein
MLAPDQKPVFCAILSNGSRDCVLPIVSNLDQNLSCGWGIDSDSGGIWPNHECTSLLYVHTRALAADCSKQATSFSQLLAAAAAEYIDFYFLPLFDNGRKERVRKRYVGGA